MTSDQAMTKENLKLPKHLTETLDFYNSKYELITFRQDASGASSTLVTGGGLQTCRYCERSEPDVQFKTDCHVLLEAIGNRHLFAEDECDSCNKLFGLGIEDHFAKWSLPYRVISCIKGKKGYPSIKREHLGWRIDSSATGISVRMREDHQIATIAEEAKTGRCPDGVSLDPALCS
ncbi:hypothetical protein KF707_22440 [Candidatus Obscuribacterales bacterium]|nr:hypothetical protein [Candidatus Obscuribacterales bacterium]MBX3139003.1 hypothetical protein [Candidatus Obscuribacterales bacterium]MBX3153490.1 hypothetical protein [Candidatus Obscuribacterales bacterium]